MGSMRAFKDANGNSDVNAMAQAVEDDSLMKATGQKAASSVKCKGKMYQ